MELRKRSGIVVLILTVGMALVGCQTGAERDSGTGGATSQQPTPSDSGGSGSGY